MDTTSCITGLAISPWGSQVCTTNDDGVVEILRADSTSGVEVSASILGISVNHLTWAPDGNRIAYAEIFSPVNIHGKSFSEACDSEEVYPQIMCFDIPEESDNIKQLLFNPTGEYILISTELSVFVVSIPNAKIETSIERQQGQYWVNHWSVPAQVIAVSSRGMTAYNWVGLEEVRQWSFAISTKIDVPKSVESSSFAVASALCREELILDNAFLTQRGKYLLLIFKKAESWTLNLAMSG